MRLLVISDLHLEFQTFELPTDLEFDVAIFAGDIWKPLDRSVTWLWLQRSECLQDKPIIYVAGNHEFYGFEINSSREDGRKLAGHRGIHLLDPGSIVIDRVRFVGGTLWSDFELLGHPIAARRAALRGMNDYSRIEIEKDGKRRTLRPPDTQRLHYEDRAFIEANLAESFQGPTVVVTHHAPSPGSIPQRFQGDELSPCFASDLTEIIEQYQPALWIHGHDHAHHDYRVGNTRILANPAGYPTPDGRRENIHFDPRLIVEI
jgi:Icc-related predicted phosphoesterase